MESQIHEQAVKLRKMTDSQLIAYIEDSRKEARDEGYKQGCTEGEKAEPVGATAMEFITFLKTEKIPGIGAVRLNTLMEVARKNGFITSR